MDRIDEKWKVGDYWRVGYWLLPPDFDHDFCAHGDDDTERQIRERGAVPVRELLAAWPKFVKVARAAAGGHTGAWTLASMADEALAALGEAKGEGR